MFKKLFGKSGKPEKKAAKSGSPTKLRVEPKQAPSSNGPASEGDRRPARDPDIEDIRAIQEALNAARTETLDSLAPAPATQNPTAGTRQDGAPREGESRAQLIRTAMTIYKHKQATLSDLDPKERAKLRSLAEEMLGVGSSGKKTN